VSPVGKALAALGRGPNAVTREGASSCPPANALAARCNGQANMAKHGIPGKGFNRADLLLRQF